MNNSDEPSKMQASTTQSEFLKCEGCGIKDETVKDMGWKFCPACSNLFAESVDAVERYRNKHLEFDGGGGA